MFTKATWHQRLYYSSYDPDSNETFEIYSKPDGSRWLSHRRASPSLTKIIRKHVEDERFDLAKRLDKIPISECEIALPPEVSKELELLWKAMLPGVAKAPNPHDLHVHTPIFIGFVQENNSIQTGSIAIAAYKTPVYRTFVEIVSDLRETCERRGNVSEALFAGLPDKVRALRNKLEGP